MLYFVRHGQTDYNLQKLKAGQIDIPLNETGFEQAKATATQLKDIKIDMVFCSPLIKAKQTCAEILKYHPNINPIYDDRLKARFFGSMEGKPTNDVKIDRWEIGQDNDLVAQYGYETIIDFYKRISDFYDDIKDLLKYKNILIVGHSGTARVSNAYFHGGIPEDGDFSKFKVSNAEIAEFSL